MSNNDTSIRLFIGAPLSMRSLRAVANAASGLKDRATDLSHTLEWIAPARYHLTLAYLGWSEPETVPAIVDAVQGAIADCKPFEFRCADLGAFPDLEAAEVLWAGATDRRGELSALAEKVARACTNLGFVAAKREFHGHVSMARLKSPSNLLKLVQSEPARMFSKTLLETLILYKNSVESNASEYEKVAQWSLRPPSEQVS